MGRRLGRHCEARIGVLGGSTRGAGVRRGGAFLAIRDSAQRCTSAGGRARRVGGSLRTTGSGGLRCCGAAGGGGRLCAWRHCR